MSVRPDEARVQEIGRELFERVAAERQAFYSADRWTAALFSWSLQHEDAKLQLFRFVDVLPSLDSNHDLVRHLREYFEGRDVPYAGLLRTALGVARVAGRLGDAVVGVMLRETVRRLARRFIAGGTPAQARRAALDARRAGQAFTLDLLGEACLSDAEADVYQARYIDLVQTLGREAPHWPSAPRLDTAPSGPLPRVNVSVKISALHPWLEPWPVPVFETKPETDASFERLTRLFLEHAEAIDLAVGSHNIRSIAHALAAREARGMAQPLVRALTERGERVRIYMPFGELIPGMAYLVRRLLENTSNESFLRRGFAEHESPEALLANAALAAFVVYEAGKPWREADADVSEAIDFIEYYRRAAITLLARRRLGDLPGEVNHFLR